MHFLPEFSVNDFNFGVYNLSGIKAKSWAKLLIFLNEENRQKGFYSFRT